MHVDSMGCDAVTMQDVIELDAAICLQRLAVVDCNATLAQIVLPSTIERAFSSSSQVLTNDVAANGVAVRLNHFDVGWECSQLLSTPGIRP
ncbi:hypothetical protein SAMN05421858_3027 [Haladaptatus litoreus]|uniref:Uncharacterized protein n=1 Tax=Haladaptatus litoreus TaxID=553468 RepID=A0A1N7CIL3_9EURY|nr:hypothetical protein SAMN05421858_3027 [Haladaptatus litoreus]